MTAYTRAYECAIVLSQDYADRLTPAQRVACECALIAGPDHAPLTLIALAAYLIGNRQ